MKTAFSVFLAILLAGLGQTTAYGQATTKQYVDELKTVVNLEQYNDPYAFTIQYHEAPHPDGDPAYATFLHSQKIKAQQLTPLNEAYVPNSSRYVLQPPQILAGFVGNNVITSTPLDNHLAVNGDEQIVSTINVHMLVTNLTGFFLGSYKLDVFFQAVGGNPIYFDPRVIYDPEQDRFIMVLINGAECAQSQNLIAFSQSNNPKGSWNLYAIDGCIDDDNTFADYPMIAITDSELFLTYNEVHSDSSWQTGFMGTQIHQINKMNGYMGEALNRKVWRDIRYNGRLLRNICPVRNADESLPADMYFLSDRNFDISNDTAFVLHLSGHYDDPNATLDISYRVLDHPYGVPPYAAQPRDSMDTNDARILDAFRLNNRIQWVNNTMDFNSGRSAIFHGATLVDAGTTTASGNVIASPTDYLGYPGISWTGANDAEQDAIITFSNTSKTKNPGAAAIYTDGYGNYSDIITVVNGLRPVDMLTGPIERWGDYAGSQRLYHQPGSIWMSGSYGRPGNTNEAWVAKLARQEGQVATHDISAEPGIKTYPNPANDYVNIEIDNPEGKKMNVALYDLAGKPIKLFINAIPDYRGKATISFATNILPAGQYMLKIYLEDALIKTEPFLKL